jgi:hypothetical protein
MAPRMAMPCSATILTYVRSHWPRSRSLSSRRADRVTRAPPITRRVEAGTTGPGSGTHWSAGPGCRPVTVKGATAAPGGDREKDAFLLD